MNFVSAALLFAIALSPPPPAAPDYVGEMTITYHPIMCVTAPCPPGHYKVSANGELLARGDVVALQIDGEWTQYSGAYLDVETVTGELWIGSDTRLDPSGIHIPSGMLQIVVRD